MLKKRTTPTNSKTAAKAPVKAAAKAPAKASGTTKSGAKPAAGKATAPAKAAEAAKVAAAAKVKPRGDRKAFLAGQRQLLLDERANYIRSAEVLKAQADSLALEHEPGDVQFDEEGGEGGTSNVDRELDLVLSAQARAAATEIDRALAKIEAGTYGDCEQCGQPIPDARLQALPQAALCVACKSGGLSSRR
ncbi:MAG TPA: TraR/DksA C4-type zinc finger protein [Acidimicrobiales bacterium]|jgi:DnaK suppressor protein